MAPPPHSEQHSEHPFRPALIGLALFIGLVILADVVVYLVSPAAATTTFRIVSLVLVVLAAAMLVVLLLYDRAYARAIRRILAGDYWAHWRYLAGEWDWFREQEHQRKRRIAGRGLLVLVVVLAVLAVLYLVSGAGANPADLAYLGLLGAGLVLALVLNRRREYTGERAYELSHGGSPEAYISPLGVLLPDGYRAVRGFDLKLVRVLVRPGNPAVLAFVRRSWIFAGMFPTSITSEFRIPIPAEHDDEARALAHRFVATFVSAR